MQTAVASMVRNCRSRSRSRSPRQAPPLVRDDAILAELRTNADKLSTIGKGIVMHDKMLGPELRKGFE
eukprot:13023041-Alexandrium_andersonii.AAC.1